MSILIVLGNTNQFTFANSIVAANSKAIELFQEALEDIFIIHSGESYRALTQQIEWMGYLESNNINIEKLMHRVVEIDSTAESVERFVHYIEFIVNGVGAGNPHMIVDITNSTSLYKNLLSTAAYILDLGHQYLIDIVKIAQLTKERGFLPLDTLQASYVPVPDATQLDSIAYLSLAEMIRYKKIIEKSSEKYVQIDTDASDRYFFEGNLAHSVQLKFQGDRNHDNAIYRIATSAISASVEDLITIMINKLAITSNSIKENQRTFGIKLKMIEAKIADLTPENFDVEFFRKFNDFILYLRNSSTHKNTDLADIERFKAELSVKMIFPFIEFYTDIIYPILKNKTAADPLLKIRKLTSSEIHPHEIFYFGLDGDNTGTILEELFLSSRDEASFKRMSNSVAHAIQELSKYIRENISKDSIIFAAGDDMLFKGCFNESVLYTLQEKYQRISGMTCSIGYGKSFKETYLALKFAKAEPGKNAIVGIELV